jgi:hypothetical protein
VKPEKMGLLPTGGLPADSPIASGGL